jgi:hypothetical protein
MVQRQSIFSFPPTASSAPVGKVDGKVNDYMLKNARDIREFVAECLNCRAQSEREGA